MNVTMSSLKVKLLKVLATTNTPSSSQKTIFKPALIIADLD